MPRKPLTPVSFTNVTFDDVFWKPRVEINRTNTLPIEHQQLKASGQLAQYRWKPGMPGMPHIFWDSDVAKWLEAAAYSLATHPDKKLAKQVDAVVDDMAAIQGKDGYLNTHYLLVEPKKRWSDLRGCHELYCAGHLMEAAVAYAEATGKTKFLDMMCRYTDTIRKEFGRGKGQKRGYPGHQEIELALVKLFRATGKKDYLDLAKFFVDERGRKPHYYDAEAKARGEESHRWHFGAAYAYCQADKPVRELAEVTGHAVRAMYLYAGMADVAAHTGDKTLLPALRRLWKSTTQRRMHVTGGIGPTAANEGFTFDYDLPNESAYLETCAAVALVFWAHRMLHLDKDAKYADVMELALYNGALSGISSDGKRFFYENPLAAHPGAPSGRREPGTHHRRVGWFGCSCCPPNIARLIASIAGYVCSSDDKSLWVHLYAGGSAEAQIGGQTVKLTQRTRYPWDGKVSMTLRPETAAEFTLALRIPGWCRKAALKVNGKTVSLQAVTKKGYAHIKRTWTKGDRVALDLPMPVERIEAHPNVRQDTGKVALKRGPIVYCFEQVDNFKNLHDIALPADAKLQTTFDAKLLGGVCVITGKAKMRVVEGWGDELFSADATKVKTVAIKAIPYALWANRKPGEMRVWLNAR
ncbi:hypothetical protein LCGC14_0781260 [marine sediment metagenome]|uniref:Glycoside hydrolase family 127 protein n=1 Tax=marine sediment metagenome TaxID=412755 RepID=A0A0F9QFA8_9ZZZZ